MTTNTPNHTSNHQKTTISPYKRAQPRKFQTISTTERTQTLPDQQHHPSQLDRTISQFFMTQTFKDQKNDNDYAIKKNQKGRTFNSLKNKLKLKEKLQQFCCFINQVEQFLGNSIYQRKNSLSKSVSKIKNRQSEVKPTKNHRKTSSTILIKDNYYFDGSYQNRKRQLSPIFERKQQKNLTFKVLSKAFEKDCHLKILKKISTQLQQVIKQAQFVRKILKQKDDGVDQAEMGVYMGRIQSVQKYSLQIIDVIHEYRQISSGNHCQKEINNSFSMIERCKDDKKFGKIRQRRLKTENCNGYK